VKYMNIKQKLTTAAATAAMMAAVVAPASFAAPISITDNGALSYNKVIVKNTSSKSVKQSNVTAVTTKVNAKAKTGGNTSSFNTGGTSTITTGNAKNMVGVSVTGGTNTNTGNDCGCVPPTTDAAITGNGAMSTNVVSTSNSTSSSVKQSNTTVVTTYVTTSASTGGNDSSFNTNGGNTTDTGNAVNEVGVVVEGTTNTN